MHIQTNHLILSSAWNRDQGAFACVSPGADQLIWNPLTSTLTLAKTVQRQLFVPRAKLGWSCEWHAQMRQWHRYQCAVVTFLRRFRILQVDVPVMQCLNLCVHAHTQQGWELLRILHEGERHSRQESVYSPGNVLRSSFLSTRSRRWWDAVASLSAAGGTLRVPLRSTFIRSVCARSRVRVCVAWREERLGVFHVRWKLTRCCEMSISSSSGFFCQTSQLFHSLPLSSSLRGSLLSSPSPSGWACPVCASSWAPTYDLQAVVEEEALTS